MSSTPTATFGLLLSAVGLRCLVTAAFLGCSLGAALAYGQRWGIFVSGSGDGLMAICGACIVSGHTQEGGAACRASLPGGHSGQGKGAVGVAGGVLPDLAHTLELADVEGIDLHHLARPAGLDMALLQAARQSQLLARTLGQQPAEDRSEE